MVNFYQKSIPEVEAHFGVKAKVGLTTAEAKKRLRSHGPNSLAGLQETKWYKLFFSQFNNLFIILLFIAALISYFVDGSLQASILLVIIVINVLFGYFQEFKAEKSLQDLKAVFNATCRVRRDYKIANLNVADLAPGDVVLLDAGDKVPADMRLVESSSLRLDESILSGESYPKSKDTVPIRSEVTLADRKNMVFASTIVVYGSGTGIVTGTGASTEFGQIAGLVSKSEQQSQLEKEVLYLSKVLTTISLAAVLVIFGLGFWRGHEVLSLLTFSIALLVAMVPESLPTVITLSLAIGTSQMAKKKVIVRRLGIIETLGTVNIIATDKTGTLTDNQLSVSRVLIWQSNNKELQEFDLGVFMSDETKNVLAAKLLPAVVCSNVKRGKGEFFGDPLEVAITENVRKLDRGVLGRLVNYSRLTEIPFDSMKKYMAVLTKNDDGYLSVAKGAPEKIVGLTGLNREQRQEILSAADKLSREGHKVIALAAKKCDKKIDLTDMAFVGLIAMIDEPSAGVTEALAKTIRAGIRPIIITGDHAETARYVAEKIGFKISDDEIALGLEVDGMTDTQLKKKLQRIKIIARATPKNKMRIVEILEKAGNSVAVTGDGVNDAPALKNASIGIAMGRRGTDVARDAADMVLANDRYSTIVLAIGYGRAIYDNIRRVITFLLAGNLDEILLVAATFLLNLPIPLLTLQILWINLITDSLPALAFAFEKPDGSVLKEKPRSALASSIKGSLIDAAILSVIAFGAGLTLYLWGLQESVEKARTLVFMSAVIHELVFAFSLRSKGYIWQGVSHFLANKFMNMAVLVAIFLQLILFLPVLSKIFGVVPLNGLEIILLLCLALFAFLSVELVKYFRQSRQSKKSSEGILALSQTYRL